MSQDEGDDTSKLKNITSTTLSRDAQDEVAAEILLERGFSINGEGFDKAVAVQWAASCGQEVAVHLLLENGADVEATEDGLGETALYWAASNGHRAVVQL